MRAISGKICISFLLLDDILIFLGRYEAFRAPYLWVKVTYVPKCYITIAVHFIPLAGGKFPPNYYIKLLHALVARRYISTHHIGISLIKNDKMVNYL